MLYFPLTFKYLYLQKNYMYVNYEEACWREDVGRTRVDIICGAFKDVEGVKWWESWIHGENVRDVVGQNGENSKDVEGRSDENLGDVVKSWWDRQRSITSLKKLAETLRGMPKHWRDRSRPTEIRRILEEVSREIEEVNRDLSRFVESLKRSAEIYWGMVNFVWLNSCLKISVGL